jgi:UPF0755 protein
MSLLGGAYYYIDLKINKELPIQDTIQIEIPLNTSNYKVIKKVSKFGGFEPEWFFDYLMKYYAKYENKFVYAGYYQFPPNTTNKDIIEALFKGGRKRTVSVTFQEGLSIEEMADLLEPIQTNKKEFLRLAYSDSLLKSRNIEAGNVLGYLLPDTYEFFLHEKASKVIDKLLDANKNIWDKKNRLLQDQSGLTKHEIITLASIVEAETPLKSEAPIVAGLYLNRVKKGMLLQADPTIQFVMGRKKRVLYRDLEIDNPYNTYMYPGLPPGPINNPGKEAIEAVLKPIEHEYLFMVAKGDGSGKHYFSRTHAQHNAFVNIYRNIRDSLKSIQ